MVDPIPYVDDQGFLVPNEEGVPLFLVDSPVLRQEISFQDPLMIWSHLPPILRLVDGWLSATYDFIPTHVALDYKNKDTGSYSSSHFGMTFSVRQTGLLEAEPLFRETVRAFTLKGLSPSLWERAGNTWDVFQSRAHYPSLATMEGVWGGTIQQDHALYQLSRPVQKQESESIPLSVFSFTPLRFSNVRLPSELPGGSLARYMAAKVKLYEFVANPNPALDPRSNAQEFYAALDKLSFSLLSILFNDFCPKRLHE